MPTLRQLAEADRADLAHLAQSCLQRDGGLPRFGTLEGVAALLRRGPGVGVRDASGRLVAAAALDEPRAVATGFVHPQSRGAGLGAALLDWCVAHAAGPLTLRIENVTPEGTALLEAAGFRRIFAEHVMRRTYAALSPGPAPSGVTCPAFNSASGPDFYAAYRGSFADRPGFPDPSAAEWLSDLNSDDFRPAASAVALADGVPVGFITASAQWIDQVGVVPAWRGRGLGRWLTAYAVAALQAAGDDEVWLCVNVDNPAHALYRRLGFDDQGLRARFRRPDSSGTMGP